MKQEKQIIGWREWVGLPALGIDAVNCKIDTGATTSALHAYYVDAFESDGKQMIRFGLHPNQDDSESAVECVTELFDVRTVSDSGGHREERYVIQTPIRIGEETFPAEITLTNRDTMAFRMLLGRRAMKERFIVDPSVSYLAGEQAE